jgi:hypothetical protein
VLNTEVAGLAHTISAMAQKRAFVLALRGAFGLSAYIKYFEGIDDVGDDDNGGTVIDSTATVKPDVPARTREHLETIRQETIATANGGSEDQHWSQKPDLVGNFNRAMANNNVPEATIKTALGAEDDSATVDTLLLGYDTVGAAIADVLAYVKEHAAL